MHNMDKAILKSCNKKIMKQEMKSQERFSYKYQGVKSYKYLWIFKSVCVCMFSIIILLIV